MSTPARAEIPAPSALLTVPVSLSVADVESLLRERITLPEERDWKRVTGEGESPEVDIRYRAELERVHLATRKNRVQVTFVISYYGSFRGRAKTPFGTIQLSKGSDWGSADKRGSIEVSVESTLDISDRWDLTVSSSLGRIKLTAPPVDKVCAGKIFKVCVSVDTVKGYVHRELEQHLRAQLASVLPALDAQLGARADLPRWAAQIWRGLNAAHPQNSDGERLWLRPRELAISYPSVDGDQLRSALRVSAQPIWSHEPVSDEERALPPPAALKHADHLDHRLDVSFAAFSERVSAELRRVHGQLGAYRLGAFKLLGAASPGRWVFSSELVRDADVLTLYFTAGLALDRTSVVISDAAFPQDSQALLKYAQVSEQDLSKLLQSQARYDLAGDLDRARAALRAALTSSLGLLPSGEASPLAPSALTVYQRADGLTLLVQDR